MACNLPRWNWLIQGTYNGLAPLRQEAVLQEFFRRHPAGSSDGGRDDVVLYDIMVELGIKIKGTDPSPPKLIQSTTPGADEYDQIMIDLESVGL